MKFKGNLKKTTVFRNLLARGVYEEVDIVDRIKLFELLDELLERARTDKVFDEKWSEWLITVQNFLNQALRGTRFPRRFKKGLIEQFNSLQPFLPSRRAYLGMKEAIDRQLKVIPINYHLPTREEKKKLMQKVEKYRDKGNLPDSAIDGSPGWKELSRSSEDRIAQNDRRLRLNERILELEDRMDWLASHLELLVPKGPVNFSDVKSISELKARIRGESSKNSDRVKMQKEITDLSTRLKQLKAQRD